MKKNFIKFSVFCCLAAVVLAGLNFFVFTDFEYDGPYNEFYEQTQNSLDLVCVGNSTVLHGINPNEAWGNFGVTSCNLGDTPTHPEVICIAIDEIARLQTPKVVYVDLNGLTYQKEADQNNFVAKYLLSMPEGECRDALLEQYSYVNPNKSNKELFANHNNFRKDEFWKQLVGDSKDYLGGFYPVYSTKKHKAYSLDPDKVIPLPEDGVKYLNKILETCKKYPQINFVFGKMPRFLNDNIVDETYKLRSAIPAIEDCGYEYVEWEDYIEDMGLNPAKDAYDDHHLNARGSVVFTNYLINYLNAHYSICSTTHTQKVKDAFNKNYKEYESKIKTKINKMR